MNYKTQISTLLLVLLIAVSCAHKKTEIPVFDYTTEYPTKEFPYEHIFNTVYIPIKSDSLLIDKSKILFYNTEETLALTGKEQKFIRIDKSGKIVSDFSKVGNAKEEYLNINDAFFSPSDNEYFIFDAQKARIIIFDKDGTYKRELPIEKGNNITAIMNFNDDYFISYNCSLGFQEDLHGSYSVIYKKDGTIVKDIVIACEGKKRYPTVVNLPKYISVFRSINMIPSDNSVILSESYCDTVYTINSKTLSVEPYMIKQPQFATLPDNNKFFLEPCLDTPDYTLFIKLNVKYNDSGAEFIQEEYFYDKKEGQFYKTSNKYGGDYKVGPFGKNNNYKNYGAFGYTLDIVDMYAMDEQGILNAPLKEILSRSTENDNPVLVLMNLKK